MGRPVDCGLARHWLWLHGVGCVTRTFICLQNANTNPTWQVGGLATQYIFSTIFCYVFCFFKT